MAAASMEGMDEVTAAAGDAVIEALEEVLVDLTREERVAVLAELVESLQRRLREARAESAAGVEVEGEEDERDPGETLDEED